MVSNAQKMLTYFSENTNEIELSEISKMADYNNITVCGYLYELESNPSIEQDLEPKGCILGSALTFLAYIPGPKKFYLKTLASIVRVVSVGVSCRALLCSGRSPDLVVLSFLPQSNLHPKRYLSILGNILSDLIYLEKTYDQSST